MAWGDLVNPNDTDPQDIPKEREGLTVQWYDMVRALLLVSLTEDQLSDDQIAGDAYFGAAKREVDNQLGTYIPQSSETDRFKIYQTAIALMTASYLCSAIQQPDSEGISVIRRAWHQTNWGIQKSES